MDDNTSASRVDLGNFPSFIRICLLAFHGRDGEPPTLTQAHETYRKTPRQARAEATVEAIFEASARILQSQGTAGFNTNAVAERAGVGVGTLYQYFANKDAILLALARRELSAAMSGVMASLQAGPSAPAETSARLAVRALLKAFGGRQLYRKALIEIMIARGHSEELSKPVEAVAAALASGLRARGAGAGLSPVRLFVATRAVIGTIRAAVMEQSAFLAATEFEDELTSLLLAYFRSFEDVSRAPGGRAIRFRAAGGNAPLHRPDK